MLNQLQTRLLCREASEALNNAQQAYDAATDETAKAELESQLATAQANLIAVTEAYNTANAELVMKTEF